MILGDVLRRWRRGMDFGVRDAAKWIGISPATLSRLERGEAVEGKTLATVLVWLMGSQPFNQVAEK